MKIPISNDTVFFSNINPRIRISQCNYIYISFSENYRLFPMASTRSHKSRNRFLLITTRVTWGETSRGSQRVEKGKCPKFNVFFP